MKIKPLTVRGYVFRMQLLLDVVIVLAYTLVVLFYFIQGLDEGGFQDLRLESKHFATNYQQGLQPGIPNSIHFKGYLGWQALPDSLKKHFPTLKNVSKVSTESVTINSTFDIWPEHVLLMVAQPLHDGKTLYLVRNIDKSQYSESSQSSIKSLVELTWPIALFFLFTMMLAVYLLTNRILKPFNKLANWTDTLTFDKAKKTTPNFEFNELNRIALQQQRTLLRMADIVDKEQDFLRHASHELRTPIAVVKSNSELLERVLSDDKAANSVARIKRAALNMQHMTETLLWLSREDTQSLAQSEVKLANMVNQLIEDNQYLLQSKAVKIHLTLSDASLQLTETPCRLILNNLIRNAFQYTAEGEINIHFSGSRINLSNINKVQDVVDYTGSDYGYGLGLRLVDKIVKKMNWKYENIEIEGGRSVTVEFN